MNFYKHYLEIKKQHLDALVFYRVGDFYELFGQDAITASEVLILTLTGRDCGLPERVPMCGVPYHNVDNYIAKLIERGYKTAICEPSTELPKPENKSVQAQGRLNLTASGTEQTILKEYLEANASDVLAEKINNGVRIEKDGKMLISKKTLETFLVYACEEARKLVGKGARAAAVKSDTVFGWLIHYLEEDSIEGTLYNEDGTEYKPKPTPRATTTKTTTAAVVTPPKEKLKAQFSLFDMLDTKPEEKPKTDSEEESELDEPEADEQKTDTEEDYPKGLHQVSETEWTDEDGVIYEITETKKEAAPDALLKLFGDLLIVR